MSWPTCVELFTLSFMAARRVSSDNAAAEYEDRTGRPASVDFALPLAMAAIVYVGRNVGARLRRVATGVQRSKIASDPAPSWVSAGLALADGVRVVRVLAGLPPIAELSVLALAGQPDQAWMFDGTNAPELHAMVTQLGAETAARGAARLATEEAGKDELQAFYVSASQWLEQYGKPTKPAMFALLSGAAGIEKFEKLRPQSQLWKDRIRAWKIR